jgi:hypothetical protein
MMGSPAGSWRAATTPSQVTRPPSAPTSQLNGSRVRSPTIEGRAVRQHKKTLSLAFFKGASVRETQVAERILETVPTDQQHSEVTATPTLRSHSKDDGKPVGRLSLSFANPDSPDSPLGALPHFPTSQASEGPRRSQSTERRPGTSKSGVSERSDYQRKGSVRKRFSILNLGKKSSKSSVKGPAGDRLAEE